VKNSISVFHVTVRFSLAGSSRISEVSWNCVYVLEVWAEETFT
jgi:hypothetical protein